MISRMAIIGVAASTLLLLCNCGLTLGTVSGITLNESNVTLLGHSTVQLVATVTAATGVDTRVTWKSSNDAIAAVLSDGLVIGTGAGDAVITAASADGTKSATCAVKVTPVAVTGVTLDATKQVAVGLKERLQPVFIPANALNQNLSWATSNSAVVAFASDGSLNPLSTGTATITITTAEGGYTASCTVTVVNPGTININVN